jgi:hypothetical protein
LPDADGGGERRGKKGREGEKLADEGAERRERISENRDGSE